MIDILELVGKVVYGFIKYYLRIYKIVSELESSKKMIRNVF